MHEQDDLRHPPDGVTDNFIYNPLIPFVGNQRTRTLSYHCQTPADFDCQRCLVKQLMKEYVVKPLFRQIVPQESTRTK